MTAKPSVELLRHAVTHTLEDAAFIFAEASDAGPGPEQGELLHAQLLLQMDATSVISAVAPAAFGALLASNLMGLQPSSPEAVRAAGDALGEFLNMTSGALADAWLGQEIPYELGTPIVTLVTEESLALLRAQAQVSATFLADDEYPVEVSVTLSSVTPCGVTE